jgi:hypothetical protein
MVNVLPAARCVLCDVSFCDHSPDRQNGVQKEYSECGATTRRNIMAEANRMLETLSRGQPELLLRDLLGQKQGEWVREVCVRALFERMRNVGERSHHFVQALREKEEKRFHPMVTAILRRWENETNPRHRNDWLSMVASVVSLLFLSVGLFGECLFC